MAMEMPERRPSDVVLLPRREAQLQRKRRAHATEHRLSRAQATNTKTGRSASCITAPRLDRWLVTGCCPRHELGTISENDAVIGWSARRLNGTVVYYTRLMHSARPYRATAQPWLEAAPGPAGRASPSPRRALAETARWLARMRGLHLC